MSKKKLFNDPIYGLIDFKDEIIYDIIDHPHFQRLRRIKQMGLSEYVYPGATHPRFQHAIGATYLLNRALEVLKSKGTNITQDERKAASIAILCHDIGHGPFSHALEGSLINLNHEEITKVFMENFKKEFGEIIDLALEIFNNKYEKKFFNQLISSQLDVDRLDYLSRDSYFTGVAEGVIGYDRIIKMLDVIDNEVVVEEKGITSVEKYLVSRYLMYKQVYLHKTSLMAEKVLNSLIRRIKFLMQNGEKINISESLSELLKKESYEYDNDKIIHYFSLTDDYDIWGLVKSCIKENDNILKFLSQSLLNRKLFKVYLHPLKDQLKTAHINSETIKNLNDFDKSFLIFQGKETINCYSKSDHEVKFLSKHGKVENLSKFCPNSFVLDRTEDVYYEIYPN